MQTVHASNHFDVSEGTAVIPFCGPELLETPLNYWIVLTQGKKN